MLKVCMQMWSRSSYQTPEKSRQSAQCKQLVDPRHQPVQFILVKIWPLVSSAAEEVTIRLFEKQWEDDDTDTMLVVMKKFLSEILVQLENTAQTLDQVHHPRNRHCRRRQRLHHLLFLLLIPITSSNKCKIFY